MLLQIIYAVLMSATVDAAFPKTHSILFATYFTFVFFYRIHTIPSFNLHTLNKIIFQDFDRKTCTDKGISLKIRHVKSFIRFVIVSLRNEFLQNFLFYTIAVKVDLCFDKTICRTDETLYVG